MPTPSARGSISRSTARSSSNRERRGRAGTWLGSACRDDICPFFGRVAAALTQIGPNSGADANSSFFSTVALIQSSRVRRLRGGTDNRLRRRGDNMTQRSRTRLTVGAASLLAAAWQLGAAPIGLAQVPTPEPNLVAPPPGTNEPKAEEAPAASLTAPSLTGPLSREPEPDQLRYRLPAREGLFRRRAHRHGDVPEQPGARQSHRDRRCAERPGLAAEQRGAVPDFRDGGRLFVSDPRDPVLPYATRLPATRSGRLRWPTARWS